MTYWLPVAIWTLSYPLWACSPICNVSLWVLSALTFWAPMTYMRSHNWQEPEPSSYQYGFLSRGWWKSKVGSVRACYPHLPLRALTTQGGPAADICFPHEDPHPHIHLGLHRPLSSCLVSWNLLSRILPPPPMQGPGLGVLFLPPAHRLHMSQELLGTLTGFWVSGPNKLPSHTQSCTLSPCLPLTSTRRKPCLCIIHKEFGLQVKTVLLMVSGLCRTPVSSFSWKVLSHCCCCVGDTDS